LVGGALPETLRSDVYPVMVNLQDKLGELNVTAQ
jgi:hypothetical protein